MLMKICRCGRLIPQNQQMCADCSKHDKVRHTMYNSTIRDHRAAQFYTSQAWRSCRASILARYDYLDIYDLFINQRMTAAEHVHHIIELTDDWSQRLNVNNLIPLSHANHSIISQLYKHDKETTQQLLRSLIARWASGERFDTRQGG